MALIKNLKCFDSFYLGKMRKEKVFGAVLDRNQAILDYKNITLRKLHNSHFPNGVSQWFCSKI